ncbi:MAG TPA: PTS sugar transporter subunit IIB [Clostridia bacterium]|nr:PTS sugar transporter subunit IIB [Clostridia bacterium]
MVRILCVCGIGLGTSMMAKMQVDKLCQEIGLKANTEPIDAGSVKGQKADLIVTTTGISKVLKGIGIKMVVIDNFAKKEELRNILLPVLEELK